MASQSCKHVVSVLNYLLVLSRLTLTGLAYVLKGENGLFLLTVIIIGLLLGMSDKDGGSLWHNGSVD